MEHIYAPNRANYLKSLDEDKNSCVFCKIGNEKQNDEQNFVLFRGEFCYMVMNLYPYNAGHFMIIPYKHIGELENLDEQIWIEMNRYAKLGVKALKKFGAKGVNIGMNLGEIGGAGIPKHLHMHLVPRWSGDTNFTTVIADTRVYGCDFTEIYKKLKKIILEVVS